MTDDLENDLEPDRDVRRDVVLLAALFVMARAMAVFWFTPIYSEFGQFFFGFAALSDVGAYPFVDYWIEYPPVFPWLSVGVYKLVTLVFGRLTPGAVNPVHLALLYRWHTIGTQLLMAAFDGGNLALIYLIVRERRGARAGFRAAWVYALLFYPLLVAGSYFDGFVLFWLLLSVWLFLRERELGSAAALAVGVMAKVVPVIFLPVALKYLKGWHRRLAYLAVFLGVTAAFAAPFLATSPAKVRSSFTAMARRRPWETVWALLEDYRSYGVVGPEQSDLSPVNRLGWQNQAGPSVTRLAWSLDAVYPEQGRALCRYRTLSRFSDDLSFIRPSRNATLYLLLAIPFLALLGVLLWRGSGVRAADNVLTLSLAALCIFLVYCKGWSPQFVIYPMALCLVTLGPYEGPMLAILLGVINYVEMPLWLIWPGLTASQSACPVLLEFAVAARTVLLLYLLGRCARALFRRA